MGFFERTQERVRYSRGKRAIKILLYLQSLQLVLCHIAAVKRLPVHHQPWYSLYSTFDPLR